MKKLEIVYFKKQGRISFVYDDNSVWNIFDIDESSPVLDLFGRLQYAIEKKLELKVITKN